jgi:hypothetical protein
MEGLREALARVLEVDPPEPDGDPLVFFRQWLGGRNLGLVPIAEPASFAWAGYWIARVGDRAVLMYGSPSGPVDGPLPAPVDAGWVVAPLDLHLATEQPYGAPAGTGRVVGVLLAPAAEAPLVRVEEALAVPGRGLEGDRYAAGRGTFSSPGRGYELTLVEAEALADVELSWEDARRNVVVEGLGLNALVDRHFRVGEVECVGRRLAEPCAHLERLARPGIMRPLVHRAGLRADILAGGTIRVGDEVEPL